MASNRYNYTWADALLAIDTSSEARRKEDEQQAIEKKRRDEERTGGVASLLLGGLGALFLGPMGWTIGTNLGELGADYWYDWEEDARDLEIGKFDQSKSISARKDYAEIAKDQDLAHAVDLAKDLAWTYSAAGGAEGYEAAKGADEKFWRTFGSTKDDPGGWTLGEAYKEGGGGLSGVAGMGTKLKGAVSKNYLLNPATNVLEGDSPTGWTEEACKASGYQWDEANQDCIMNILEDKV